MRLGTPASELKGKIPAWFEKPLPERTGETYGNIPASEEEDGEPCAVMFATLAFSVGRLSRVDVTIDLTSEDEIEPVFRELADAFDGLGEATEVKKDAKKNKYAATWSLPSERLKSELRVRAAPYYMGQDMDYIPRVELSLDLAEGEELKEESGAISWIDVGAVARLLATKAFPETECVAAFGRFFAYDDAPTWKDEDAAKKVSAIYEAVKTERADRESTETTIRGLLALCDWTSLEDENDRDGRRIGYALWGAAARPGAPGALFQLEAGDLFRLVKLISKTPSDRPEWAWKIIAGVERGDEAAFGELRDAIAALRAAKAKKDGYVSPWDFKVEFHDPNDSVRLYELVTSGLSLEERVKWALTAEPRMPALAAAAEWLAAGRGLAPAPLKARMQNDYAAMWTQYLATVRAHSEALFHDALGETLRQLDYQQETAQEVCELLGPDERHDDTRSLTTFWTALRLGPFVVIRTGKKGKRGRLTVKRHPDDAAAAKELAKKVKGRK